jgi:hypothetical protein
LSSRADLLGHVLCLGLLNLSWRLPLGTLIVVALLTAALAAIKAIDLPHGNEAEEVVVHVPAVVGVWSVDLVSEGTHLSPELAVAPPEGETNPLVGQLVL